MAIDFRYPRSSGGKFFARRIDEGMSRLRQNYYYTSPPAIPEEQSLTIWQWEPTDGLTDIEGPYYVGNVGGGAVTASYSEFIASDYRNRPKIDIELSNNFATNLSGGAFFRLNTPALPRRFGLKITWDRSVSTGNSQFNFLFNATKIDSQAEINNLYGSVLTISDNSTVPNGTQNIQTGTIGHQYRFAQTTGFDDISYGNAIGESKTIVLYFEMQSLVGLTSGSMWKVSHMDYHQWIIGESETTQFSKFNMINYASASYSSWAGISGTNNLYIGFCALTNSASKRIIGLQEISILRHPSDWE